MGRKFRSVEDTLKILKIPRGNFYVATLSEAEVYSGKDISRSDKKEEVKELLKIYLRVVLDSKLAVKAGEIRRKYGLRIDDAVIAATALSFNLTLITRNLKHFKKVKNLKLLSP